jgi:hypothetical protein
MSTESEIPDYSLTGYVHRCILKQSTAWWGSHGEVLLAGTS